MYASFMGKREILRLMLESPKSLLLRNWERKFASRFGFLVFRMLGYPLDIRQRHMRIILSNFLKNTKTNDVLDVGCSIGYDCFALATKKDCTVLGIDIDNTSIQLANDIKNVLDCRNTEFQLTDIMKGSIENKQFDTVIFFEVLEHIQDDAEAIRQVHRLLKPEGSLLLAVPYSEKAEKFVVPKAAFSLKEKAKTEGEFIGGYHWRKGYNEETLSTLLRNGGFKLEDLRTIRIPKIIFKHDQNKFGFFLLYPLSRLLSRFSKNKRGLVAKAVKVPSNFS